MTSWKTPHWLHLKTKDGCEQTGGYLTLILGRANATSVLSDFRPLLNNKETKEVDQGEISQTWQTLTNQSTIIIRKAQLPVRKYFLEFPQYVFHLSLSRVRLFMKQLIIYVILSLHPLECLRDLTKLRAHKILFNFESTAYTQIECGNGHPIKSNSSRCVFIHDRNEFKWLCVQNGFIQNRSLTTFLF